MFRSKWREFPSAPCPPPPKKKLDNNSRLDVFEIPRLPDILPSPIPSRAKDLSAPRVCGLYGSENKQVHP